MNSTVLILLVSTIIILGILYLIRQQQAKKNDSKVARNATANKSTYQLINDEYSAKLTNSIKDANVYADWSKQLLGLLDLNKYAKISPKERMETENKIFEEAEQMYKKAVEINPDYTIYQDWATELSSHGKNVDNLREVKISLHTYSEALDAINKADKETVADDKIKLLENWVDTLRYILEKETDEKYTLQGIRLLEELLILKPDDKQNKQQLIDLRTIHIGLDPKDTEAYTQCYKNIENLIAKHGDDADAYASWALVLSKQGEQEEKKELLEQSIQKIEKATQLAPSPEKYVNWSKSLFLLGSTTKNKSIYMQALDKIKEAGELYPDNEGIYAIWASQLVMYMEKTNDYSLYSQLVEICDEALRFAKAHIYYFHFAKGKAGLLKAFDGNDIDEQFMEIEGYLLVANNHVAYIGTDEMLICLYAQQEETLEQAYEYLKMHLDMHPERAKTMKEEKLLQEVMKTEDFKQLIEEAEQHSKKRGKEEEIIGMV